MNSLPPKNQAATLSAVNLLTVIAPVHNNEGRITVRVEELLDILTDARIPFEFLLLDFASTDSTTDMISELGRMYPQIKSVYYPELEINGAISAAIKAAEGDLIVILEEGPYAVTQLTQLLKESLQFPLFHSRQQSVSASSHRASTTVTNTTDVVEDSISRPQVSSEAVAGDQTAIDPDHYDLSGRNFGRTKSEQMVPELPGIESQVLKRLEHWAAALQREAEQREQALEQESQQYSRPIESTDGDSIERLDAASSTPQRKLPKFITRFHEFI